MGIEPRDELGRESEASNAALGLRVHQRPPSALLGTESLAHVGNGLLAVKLDLDEPTVPSDEMGGGRLAQD
jgi:hypothetical protein